MGLIHQLFNSRLNSQIMQPAGWLVGLVDSNQSSREIHNPWINQRVKSLVNKALSIIWTDIHYSIHFIETNVNGIWNYYRDKKKLQIVAFTDNKWLKRKSMKLNISNPMKFLGVSKIYFISLLILIYRSTQIDILWIYYV